MTKEDQNTFECIEIIQKHLRKWKHDLKSGLGISYSYECAVKEILELVKYGA